MICQSDKKSEITSGTFKVAHSKSAAFKIKHFKSGKFKFAHYVAGAASIMNLAGRMSLKSKRKSDAEAIRGDFRAVGGDLRIALNRAHGDVPEQLNLTM
jgi:hypothetical protein